MGPNVEFLRFIRCWKKFNFNQKWNLDQIQKYLKHHRKWVMVNPSTPAKKGDNRPSSSSSKGSKKKATFKKFMQWLVQQSDDDSILLTES